MTGRERLWAALNGQPVDELPVSLQGLDPHHPNRGRRGASWDAVIERYAETGDYFSQVAPAVRSAGDWPVQRRSRCLAKTSDFEDYETTIETPAGVLTQVRRNLFVTGATLKPAVESTADFAAARWALTEPLEVDAAATVERSDRLCADPNAMPLLHVSEPIGKVVGYMGAERFAWSLAEARDEVAELVDAVAAPGLALLEATLRTGIRPVVWTVGAEWCVPPYSGPGVFRQLVLPYLRQIAQVAHQYGCPVHSHCHGGIGGVLDQFLEAGIDGTHPFEGPPMGNVTPSEIKARAGGSLCCVGNIQLDDVLRAPRETIDRQVRDLLAVFSDWPQGRFVLSTSGTPACREASPQAVENYLHLLACKRP